MRQEQQTSPYPAGFARRAGESLKRPFVLALVMLGHVGLLMVMLRPATPLRDDNHTSWTDDRASMQVRFVRLQNKPATSEQPITSTPRIPHVQAKLHATRVQHATPVAPALAANVDVPDSAIQTPTSNTYISGGSGFRERLQESNNAPFPKVPGGDFVAGAPRFRMIEERSAGAMLVHYIGRMMGAVDSHCVDVNTWQGMTPEERIAAHVSQSDIERTADAYHCIEPERFKNAAH